MIKMARQHHKDIEFIKANVLKLPFESNNFDAVIATSLINIVDDKLEAVKQLLNACKAGGHIAFLVPSDRFDDTQLTSLRQQLKISGFSSAALEVWHKSAPKMSDKEMINLFQQVGIYDVTKTAYLDGMVLSFNAIKPL